MRVKLWPLWGVVLGLWFPLNFLFVLDGYNHFLRVHQFPFVYATGWSLHAVPLILLCAGIAAGQTLVLRSARLVGWVDWLVVAAARALAGVVVIHAVIAWLRTVSPGIVPAVPSLLKWIALASGCAALALTAWRPAPGRLLQLSRGIAVASAIAVAILLPIEAVMTAVGSRTAPARSTLKVGERPDVVLITIDTLAANHMSLYGYGRDTTPRLDDFAQGATVFDRFYATSNFTSPASGSFLYGVRPWAHRSWNIGGPPIDALYGKNLLQHFHDAGYRVMTVDTNPCAAPVHNRLLPWIDDMRSLQIRTSFLWSYWPNRWLPSFDAAFVSPPLHRLERYIDKVLLKLGWFAPNAHFAPEVALDAARELWTESSAQPRFLWVHLFGPHDPYAPPPEFLGAFEPSERSRTRFDSTPHYQWHAGKDPSFPGALLGRYDESIRYFDHHVGGFVAWLKEQGSFDGSLIVVSADHGESFSRGYGGHGGPLLTEELIRIPLIIKPPAPSVGGRNQVVLDQADLPQIILKQAGLPEIEGAEGRAVALDAAGDDDPAFAMNFERNRRFDALQTGSIAMMQGAWKYVHYMNLKDYRHMPAMPDELYDLRADPAEQVNLLNQDPARAAQMKTAILQQLQAHAQAVQ